MGIFLLRECYYSRFGLILVVFYVCYILYLLFKEKNIFVCWILNLCGLCVVELLKVVFMYICNEIGFDIVVVELVFFYIKYLIDFW